MPVPLKTCHCGAEFYRFSSLQNKCPNCAAKKHPRLMRPHKQSKVLRPRKRMRKIGPVTKKWIETRNKWLEANKAEYYICHYCPAIMTRSRLTLDHYKSRGRHPELRYSLNNLVPCCLTCNTEKGSLNGDEYIKKKKEKSWQEQNKAA